MQGKGRGGEGEHGEVQGKEKGREINAFEVSIQLDPTRGWSRPVHNSASHRRLENGICECEAAYRYAIIIGYTFLLN